MLWWTKRQLQSGDSNVRQAAVRKLAQTGDDNIIELLLPAFDDKHPDVRKAAVEALAKFDRPEVHTRLASKLSDEETQVCEAAAHALDAFGWKPEDIETRVRFASVRKKWQELVGYGEQGIKALLKAAGQLEDRDSARAAHDLLVSLGRDVVDPLLHLLDMDLKAGLGGPHLGLSVTVAGVGILGELRDARAINLLGEELKYFARGWILTKDEPALGDQQTIDLIFQKALWETVLALISCGEPGVAALVDAARLAEDEIRNWYLKLHPHDVMFIGASQHLTQRSEWEFGRLRRQIEAMICAPLAASQLKIAPPTRESQLAMTALAAMREFVEVSYKDQRVLKIISLFAGVPVTEDMIR